MSTPILAYPDYQLPFVPHADSSSEGLGAVLHQKQNEKLRVIAYASRSVSKAESNYLAHKLEFLALKWAVCEKFHEYLYGSKSFELDVECMDTHVVNAILTYSRSKSSLIEYVSCSSKIIPDELNLDSGTLSEIDWVKEQRADPNLCVIMCQVNGIRSIAEKETTWQRFT